jgi:hypothetical protein
MILPGVPGALARAGLPRFRFHDLRHGSATFLLAQGMTLEDLKNQLGHSGPRLEPAHSRSTPRADRRPRTGTAGAAPGGRHSGRSSTERPAPTDEGMGPLPVVLDTDDGGAVLASTLHRMEHDPAAEGRDDRRFVVLREAARPTGGRVDRDQAAAQTDEPTPCIEAVGPDVRQTLDPTPVEAHEQRPDRVRVVDHHLDGGDRASIGGDDDHVRLTIRGTWRESGTIAIRFLQNTG